MTAGESRAQRLSHSLTYGAFRAAAALTKGLPGVFADGLAVPVAYAATMTSPDRRALVARHLQRVDPTLRGSALRQAVFGAFDSYSRYWIEAARLPYLSPEVIRRGIVVNDYDHVIAALEQGNGAILALPHLGGWEWAGRWLAINGNPLTVVVERIEPPELFDWFVGLRTRLGMNVVSLGPDAGRQILAALRRNEIVCLLCDRDIQGGGIPVTFFGEVTTLPAGPATIALRTGAPLLPVAVYFTNRVQGHVGLVRPAVPATRDAKLRDDVARVTQALAGELECLIRRAPSQWHMFQPNWPSDPGYGC